MKTNRPLEIIGGDSKSTFIHYADGDCEYYTTARGANRAESRKNAEAIIEARNKYIVMANKFNKN